MNKDEAQRFLTQFEEKYALWSKAYNLAHTMINAFNRNSRNIKDANIRTYLTTNGNELYTKTSAAIHFLRVEIKHFRSDGYNDSAAKCAKYVTVLGERFKHYDSQYPELFTNYLKRAIASCNTHFTQVETREEIQELEKFIQNLPKELLLEDLLPAVREVKDKISAYQQVGDKDKHIQQLNTKLIDEHSILSEQSRVLKAELEQNKKLLKEQEAQKKS